MGHADEQQARAPAGLESPPCPACGARPVRAGARYCATCGRHLRERDYCPADRLRASYRWPAIAPPVPRRAGARAVPAWRRRNDQTAHGYVFLAYAFVPFVGVVFCACAFACCAAGLRAAKLERRPSDAPAARRGVAYAVLLAGAQTFIWLVAFYLPWRALS